MKKTLRLSKVIFLILIVFLTIIFITMSLLGQITKKPFSILGVSYGVVQTASMEPDILVGDFVVMNEVAYENLNIGDVIAFESSNNRVIIHQIIAIEAEGIITQGINNAESDFNTEGYITEDRYLAKVVWHGGSMIGIYLVNQRLLVIGLIIILIMTIFIVQMMMFIYELINRQKVKHQSDLDKLKAELKQKQNKNQD